MERPAASPDRIAISSLVGLLLIACAQPAPAPQPPPARAAGATSSGLADFRASDPIAFEILLRAERVELPSGSSTYGLDVGDQLARWPVVRQQLTRLTRFGPWAQAAIPPLRALASKQRDRAPARARELETLIAQLEVFILERLRRGR